MLAFFYTKSQFYPNFNVFDKEKMYMIIEYEAEMKALHRLSWPQSKKIRDKCIEREWLLLKFDDEMDFRKVKLF